MLLPNHVGGAQEFKGKGKFKKTQSHLDGIEPSARLGQTLKPTGEGSKQDKGQRKGKTETKHAYRRAEELATNRGSHQKLANEGTGTAEAHQGQGKCHEKNTQNSASLGLVVGLINPGRRQRYLKKAKET